MVNVDFSSGKNLVSWETLFFVSFKMSLLFAKNVQSIFFYKNFKKAYLKK